MNEVFDTLGLLLRPFGWTVEMDVGPDPERTVVFAFRLRVAAAGHPLEGHFLHMRSAHSKYQLSRMWQDGLAQMPYMIAEQVMRETFREIGKAGK